DPAAEEWSQWSVCSLTCGQGWQVRSRSCVSSPYGTLCSGPLRETRLCNNTATCPGEPQHQAVHEKNLQLLDDLDPISPLSSSLIPIGGFVGVCSAWAVGGVVFMEPVLGHVWPWHSDPEQDLCAPPEWNQGLWRARGANQTLQYSCVPRQTQTLAVPVSLSVPPTACFLFVPVPHFFVLLFPVLPPHLYCLFLFSPLHLSLCVSLWLCLQWRDSGWTGRPGLSALFLVALELSRGSGVAVCRFMAGRSVRGHMWKLVNAPTHLVEVEGTGAAWNHWSLCFRRPGLGYGAPVRMCEGTGIQGYPCDGSGEEVRSCNDKKCPGACL
ncbi:hypothetical protein cypCar_00029161, partial [Cyprinus carpio]